MESQPNAMTLPTEPQRPNRRRHARYSCEGHAEVCLPNGGLLLRGKILDLSLSGCFIQTPAINLERGTSVEVYFATRKLQFRVAGHIAALHPRRGAGIAFHNLQPRHSEQIAVLIAELKQIAEGRQPAPASSLG